MVPGGEEHGRAWSVEWMGGGVGYGCGFTGWGVGGSCRGPARDLDADPRPRSALAAHFAPREAATLPRRLRGAARP